VLVPSSFLTSTAEASSEIRPAGNDKAAPQHLKQQQSWKEWAASGLSLVMDAAKDQLLSLATLAAPEQHQQQQPSSFIPDASFMMPLRMSMVYGSAPSTQSQLQQMRQGLARAASLQQDAMLLIHDAEIAEDAAAQQMHAAHVIMSGEAEPDSSSSEGGNAAYQAGQLLRGAQAAQQAADEMQEEAELLLDAAASEAAKIATAIADSMDQPGSSSSSTVGSQRFYRPAMLGAIFGTSAARSAADTAAALEDEYYYDESNDGYDSLDDAYDALYTYGDVDAYSYDDDDLMVKPAPPAAATGANYERVAAPTADPQMFGLISAAAAAVLGHLVEIHGEDAYSRPDLLHWASKGGSGTLPPPAWPITDPAVALPPRFVSSSSRSSDRHHMSELPSRDSLTGQAGQQSAYFYEDMEDSPSAAAPTQFSFSVIIASALQVRLVKLAARAAAASQQQLDAAASSAPPSTLSSSSSSGEQEVVAIASILAKLGPLPMSMTIKREEEMLQLAAFFDSLYPKLSSEASSQLNDLDFNEAAVLDAVLVGGLPALVVGQQLVGLMAPGDAAVLRSMLHAQMAELFADLVTLVS
jgi:hypothetical protein